MNKTTPFRIEVKMPVSGFSISTMRLLVESHPLCFQPVYHKRRIHNIYYDTLSLNDYYENIHGNMNRKKVRLRWYDDCSLGGMTSNLELKKKQGIVGWKNIFGMQSAIDGECASEDFSKVTDSLLDFPVFEYMGYSPSSGNSYDREYYVSSCCKFRITLDYNISYCDPAFFLNQNGVSIKDPNMLIEIKFAVDDLKMADEVVSFFPQRVGKNSKYINGVQRLRKFGC